MISRIALSCSCMSIPHLAALDPAGCHVGRWFGCKLGRVDAQATSEGLPLGRAGDQELHPCSTRQRLDLGLGRASGHHPHLRPFGARDQMDASRSALSADGASGIGGWPWIEPAAFGAALLSWIGSSKRGLPFTVSHAAPCGTTPRRGAYPSVKATNSRRAPDGSRSTSTGAIPDRASTSAPWGTTLTTSVARHGPAALRAAIDAAAAAAS